MWLELLRERPALAAELLDYVRSGLVPAFERAQLESADLSEHAPVSYHADAVVTLGDEAPALAVLPQTARDLLEAMMTTGTREYKSDFARRYFSQGEAKVILTVLAARGVSVPEDVQARINGCTDREQLEVWARRAATADSIEDLFG